MAENYPVSSEELQKKIKIYSEYYEKKKKTTSKYHEQLRKIVLKHRDKNFSQDKAAIDCFKCGNLSRKNDGVQ